MIFKWPSGRLDHWHLFNRKLLYRALGYLTLDWDSDGLIDSQTVKRATLGQSCKRQTEKMRQEDLIVTNWMSCRYGDVRACSSHADRAGRNREAGTWRHAYVQRDSQGRPKRETRPSIQEQSQSAPVGILPQCNPNMHVCMCVWVCVRTHTHTHPAALFFKPLIQRFW